MPLLKVSEVVEILLVPNPQNSKAAEEIKDSMLERIGYDYKDYVTVEWYEDDDGYSVITKEEFLKEGQSIEADVLMQIEVLMMLIFKDDMHNLQSRDEQRKVTFLAHLVRGG